MNIFSHFQECFEATRQEEYSLQEYLDLCKQDRATYTPATKCLLVAIGGPELLDTSVDSRLLRIFSNKAIRRYPAFTDLHGMEKCADQVATFFRHAVQRLEEERQTLYLLDSADGGKPSLAEKLKQLVEEVPFYAIKNSSVSESPLSLFNLDENGAILEEDYGIPRHYLRSIMSSWTTKRLNGFSDDISRLRVVKLHPSILNQITIAKTEPGDENNQDIPTLVGKVDIRKLEEYPQSDMDTYSYSGTLCRANQGLMELVEMFKAPIKVLHLLLTATQEGNYSSTEGLGALPYSGIILAHSNESEWHSFRNNKNNGAFIDCIYIVKVPHYPCVADEIKIYDKLLVNSSLAYARCAPDTPRMPSQFFVLSRPKEPENLNIYSKMRVYDGGNLKDTGPKAKSIQGYRDSTGVDEDMTGLSTRFAFKILSKVFDFGPYEVATNPVHLLYVLEQQIGQGQLQLETRERYLRFIKEHLTPCYVEFASKEIQTIRLESCDECSQNIFDRYVLYADFWIQDRGYRGPETGEILNRTTLNEELEKIGKPTDISNPKDSHNEIVNFVLRAHTGNDDKNSSWLSYEKLHVVIEEKIFFNTEGLLPVISFNAKAGRKNQQRHNDFVKRMVERGYTEKQARLLSEWHLRAHRSQ